MKTLAEILNIFFGTKAEDLGKALFALDPKTAVGALGQVTGAADQVGVALGEAAERAEFFDKEVVYAARAALARVPNALRVQACPACTPTGYNDGGGDGYTAYSCHHPQVAIYDMTTPVA